MLALLLTAAVCVAAAHAAGRDIAVDSAPDQPRRTRAGVHVVGTPGAHAKNLADAAGLSVSAATAAAVIAAAVWLAAVAADRRYLIILVPAALTAAARRTYRPTRSPAKLIVPLLGSPARAKATAGLRAEQTVAAAIERTKGLRWALHGQMIGAGGDADHVVVGPVLVVVETKAGGGPLSVAPDGTISAGSKILRGDPIGQAARQAAAVARIAGVPAAAVVCLDRTSGAPRQVRGVTVCGAKDLPQVLRGLPSGLDDAHADRIAGALLSRAR